MNLPNAITLSRVVLAVLFLPLFLTGGPWTRLVCLGLMIIIFLSDAIDGKLARRYNQVTDFGKLFDPLADKVAVILILLALGAYHRLVPAWVVWLIFLRESAVTFLREVAYAGRLVVAARTVGKVKTVSQVTALHVVMVLALVIEFRAWLPWVRSQPPADLIAVIRWISLGALLPAVVMTLYSGAVYAYAYRDVIRQASRPLPAGPS